MLDSSATKRSRAKRDPGTARSLALEVGEFLHRAYDLQDRGTDRRLRPFRVTQPQMGVLYFATETGVSMGELAGKLWCHVSNLTGVVDRLERQGLARREPHPRDRRTVLVRLTPTGLKLQAVLMREMVRFHEEQVRNLTLEEQRQLCALLRKYIGGAR